LSHHYVGLAIVDSPLAEIDGSNDDSYKNGNNRRQALSDRHPTLVGIGVVLLALSGACGGMALGYLGTNRLAPVGAGADV
jgi:hypothetical protein